MYSAGRTRVRRERRLRVRRPGRRCDSALQVRRPQRAGGCARLGHGRPRRPLGRQSRRGRACSPPLAKATLPRVRSSGAVGKAGREVARGSCLASRAPPGAKHAEPGRPTACRAAEEHRRGVRAVAAMWGGAGASRGRCANDWGDAPGRFGGSEGWRRGGGATLRAGGSPSH